ncbi:MAG: hypothetical protein ACI8QC_002785 [Planctomycetota bacterium]|jgi:hypothetical protein
MPAKNQDKNESETDQDQAAEQTAAEESSSETLDFEGMDLSVESVEERISPSETNVFDK